MARALAKDPAQRYQTAVEFRADVERAIAGVPVTRVMAVPPAGGAGLPGDVGDRRRRPVRDRGDGGHRCCATGAMPPVIPGGCG